LDILSHTEKIKELQDILRISDEKLKASMEKKLTLHPEKLLRRPSKL